MFCKSLALSINWVPLYVIKVDQVTFKESLSNLNQLQKESGSVKARSNWYI